MLKTTPSDALLAARERLGMTQADFGSKVLGVTNVTVSEWETGARKIPRHVWDTIYCHSLRALGTILPYDAMLQDDANERHATGSISPRYAKYPKPKGDQSDGN